MLPTSSAWIPKIKILFEDTISGPAFVGLILDSETLNVQKIVNEIGLTRLVKVASSGSDVLSAVEQIVVVTQNRSERQNLIRNISLQKRHASVLIQKQEEEIISRTLDIELSTQEQNHKLKRERQLLKFIKDLGQINYYDEFINGIRNEFKSFHEVSSIFLLNYERKKYLNILTPKQSEEWRRYESTVNWNHLISTESDSRELSQELANLLGRPFGKVISLELDNNHSIIFEIQMSGSAQFDFYEFFSDRKELLKMVFNKINTSESVASVSVRWKSIFDFIKDPMALIDKEYNLVSSNKAFKKTSSGSKCYQQLANREHPCLGCPVSGAFNIQSIQETDLFIGDTKFKLKRYPIFQETDKRIHLHFYADQTQNDELMAELIQSRKMAEIGRLAGHLSHELNNPLTGIKSLAEFHLNETSLSDQERIDLQELLRASERSLAVIKNFVDFSSGDIQKKETIDINEIIKKTIPLVKTSLRNINLNLDLKAKNAAVFINSSLIQQALVNLIKNSIQAIELKGKITISTDNTSAESVLVTIADSGIGIPYDIQDKLFKLFVTTKSAGTGTGLGLSIVKKIIEGFHGKIWFKSSPGSGSHFFIEFPLARDL